MVCIHELENANPELIHTIAELHRRAFPTFFLTQLGTPFLRTLYSGYIEDVDSGVIVAEDESRMVGFIAYSKDYPKFYKGLIKNHLIKFAVCSLSAVICHPTFIKRILGAFKKSESVVKEEQYVELASICVDPSTTGKGIGSALIDYFKGIVDFDRFAYINLETDAINNDDANRFYQKNGFKLSRTFTTAEGRRMNEYRYRRVD